MPGKFGVHAGALSSQGDTMPRNRTASSTIPARAAARADTAAKLPRAHAKAGLVDVANGPKGDAKEAHRLVVAALDLGVVGRNQAGIHSPLRAGEPRAAVVLGGDLPGLDRRGPLTVDLVAGLRYLAG